MQGLAERMSPGSEYRSGAELREYQRRYDAAPPEARRRTLSEALTLANESLSLLAALIPGPHQMAAISHQVRAHRPNMDSVLQALALSDLRAKTLFVEKLSGLDVGAALLAAAKAIGKEFLIYVGGSVVVGTAVGAAIANAPGAAAGATTGARLGFTLMNRLGIGFLILGGALSLKEAAGYYVKGFACAWVAAEVPEEHVAKRRQLLHQAVESMAQGHLFLMLAILQGVVAYVSKGAAPKAEMYAKLKNADLANLANWAKANEPVLVGVPVLKQQTNKSVGELVEAAQRDSSKGPARQESRAASTGGASLSREEMTERIAGKLGKDIKGHPLRQAYESEVAALDKLEASLRKSGLGDREVASRMHQARRDLGVKYKNVTPEPLRDYIYEVNKGRYGDPLGPKFEDLAAKYNGNYEKIIDGAKRPNPNVDGLLDGFKKWLDSKPAEQVGQYFKGLDE